VDDALDAADQAAVDRIQAELQAASEAGLLELMSEAFKNRIDREATMALLSLAIRHFAWVAHEDADVLVADPGPSRSLPLWRRHESRRSSSFQCWNVQEQSLLARVALQDALRCVKALTDYRARHGAAPSTPGGPDDGA